MMRLKRNILLNPGPATTTDSVKRALLVPDICPREKEFTKLVTEIRKDLVKVAAGDKRYTAVLFSGAGTAAMEACMSSVVPPNKKVAIIVNGAYGKRFVEIAETYQLETVVIPFPSHEIPNLRIIEDVLKKDRQIRVLAIIHHETTTGLLNPIREVGKIAAKYRCTYIVDAMSSFAGIPINIIDCDIDFLISTSNKCIQGMPGISFVIGRIEALNRLEMIPPRSFYLNLYQQYRFLELTGEMQFTPPVQVIYALKRAIQEYRTEGAWHRYQRYSENWLTLRRGLEKLGFKFLLNQENESRILTTVHEPQDPKFDFQKFHDQLYKKGYTIYPGKLGELRTFRLANMGAINKKDIKNFMREVEKVLKKMGLPLIQNNGKVIRE